MSGWDPNRILGGGGLPGRRKQIELPGGGLGIYQDETRKIKAIDNQDSIEIIIK